jgi:iron only hydrogenase large subunit-like protein
MSALLSDTDLNDFISPGLACIKPAGEVRASNQEEAFEVSIDDGAKQGLTEANISLQDCLACSGCITSAEEVLLAKQTHKVLLDDLKKYTSQKVFVLSISHQSRVSLGAFWSMPTHKVDELLINMFSEKYGFKFAVGTELARLMSIARINNELIQMKRSEEQPKVQLSSICPGFVLYIEKTKPEILPYLLNVKSPQQITGFVLKSLISKQLNIALDDIYHLSIMPCFDKKLEAARPEDHVDVDCVLTPKEIAELVKEEQIDIKDYVTPLDEIPTSLYMKAAPQNWPYPMESWYSNLGSASGGYSENYIIALQQFYEQQGVKASIKEVKGKNSDVVEFQLVSATGEKLGSSSIVNGFRNIQNLVRKLKPSGKVKIGSGLAARRKSRKNTTIEASEAIADPSSCDFVEVMACPGGCINGGGVNNGGNTVDNKQLVIELTKLYQELPQVDQLNHQTITQFVADFTEVFGVADERMFQYKFSAIEKATDILSVGSKW